MQSIFVGTAYSVLAEDSGIVKRAVQRLHHWRPCNPTTIPTPATITIPAAPAAAASPITWVHNR